MQFLELAAGRKRSLEWDAIRDKNQGDPNIREYNLTNLPIKGIQENTYDGIYSEHFIEHLYKYQGINLFIECLRILKPGGVIRTVWPSYDFVEKLVSEEDLSNDEFVQYYYQRYCVQERFQPKGYDKKRKQEIVALGLLYQKGEHLYLWGVREMMDQLKQIGFVSVTECEYNKSKFVPFNQIDTPNKIRMMHSSVVEAKKPW
jgi:SAM-dependent methyltransferase